MDPTSPCLTIRIPSHSQAWPPALYVYRFDSTTCDQSTGFGRLTLNVPLCDPLKATNYSKYGLELPTNVNYTQVAACGSTKLYPVLDGQCSDPYVLSDDDAGVCMDDDDGVYSAQFCSDGLPGGAFDPWDTPEAIHSVYLLFDTSGDCSGENPTSATFFPSSYCEAQEDMSSLMTHANGMYTTYKEAGCTGESMDESLPASENGLCTKIDDTTSTFRITTWSCPAGCEHDYAKIKSDRGAPKRQLRQLLFGGFKKTMPTKEVTCPAHCMATMAR
jgi:hypothetical protein